MDADLVLKLGVILAVLALVSVLAGWDTYRDHVLRVGRALHVTEPPPPQPAGPPIERIAADIRRIRAQIAHAPPGMPVARMRGWLDAYDEVLVTACNALGLEEQIRAIPHGAQRNLERERVERALMRAGLRLRSPA